MKSWTRTLNLDDAHTLLALARPGLAVRDWAEACHSALPHQSMPRRRELIRMIRNDFLLLTPDRKRIADGLFLRCYAASSALAQLDLVRVQWALSHELTRIAIERFIAPALASGDLHIPLSDVEDLVAEHLETASAESRRKTRTVLLGALEGIGVLETRGTGQHRSLKASRGQPHPAAFGYLVLRELADRGAPAMMASEVAESSLGATLTQCRLDHAEACVQWNLQHGVLTLLEDEIRTAA